jgi:hypothetical protein
MEFNLDNLIDEYLAGTMDAAAREDFDRRMAADPDLAARVQLERELFEVIGASPENELRANLRQLSEKFDTPESLNEIAVLVPRKQGRNGWVLPVLLLVALVAAFFVFRSMQTSPPVSSPVLQQSPPQQQVTPGTPAKEIQQQPSQPDKAVQKSRPVASAYAPIPKLETYIGSQFRSSDFRIVVDAPATGAALKATSGKLNFKLSGKTEGDLPAGASFRVLVFNNNVRDFEKMKPVESSALPVSADGQFLFKKEVPTPPGLYYFLIEEEQSGTWVYVSKFRVE